MSEIVYVDVSRYGYHVNGKPFESLQDAIDYAEKIAANLREREFLARVVVSRGESTR